MIDLLKQKWRDVFGSQNPDVIIRAPGRVNIIGEHTDYNQGWVLPGAMDRVIYIFMSSNDTGKHHWIANDLNEEWIADTLMNATKPIPAWAKYIQGAIHLFSPQTGPLKILIGGDLPVGAGISSSSALVCGTLFGLQQLNGHSGSKEELAMIGSRVEREVMGLQGGIMDQFAIMLSQPEHVLVLDCQSKTYRHIYAGLPDCRWILINTKVKHELIDSDYNQRAAECQQAVQIIKNTHPDVQSLRNVTGDMLKSIPLPEILYRRVLFVLEENDRVHQMVLALQEKQPDLAGNLLQASHQGLRDQYEVSCEELDFLADYANQFQGVYGARMMGGGFGGCVIALLKADQLDDFQAKCIPAYAHQFGFEPEVILFSLGGGVEQINIP
jgi:galactokinase